MINGVDLLFAVIALVGIFLLWHFGERYADWMEWNHRRRRQRMRTRMRVADELEMEEYIHTLRLTFRLNSFGKAMIGISDAVREASKAFEKFNRQFAEFAGSQEKRTV